MSDSISNIDKNFAVPNSIKKDGVAFYNTEAAPLKYTAFIKKTVFSAECL